jgi:hypothetical protein
MTGMPHLHSALPACGLAFYKNAVDLQQLSGMQIGKAIFKGV